MGLNQAGRDAAEVVGSFADAGVGVRAEKDVGKWLANDCIRDSMNDQTKIYWPNWTLTFGRLHD